MAVHIIKTNKRERKKICRDLKKKRTGSLCTAPVALPGQLSWRRPDCVHLLSDSPGVNLFTLHQKQTAAMKDLVKWNTRVSALYALGIWTMISSYAYFKYTGRLQETPPGGGRSLGHHWRLRASSGVVFTMEPSFVRHHFASVTFLLLFFLMRH